MVVSPDGRYLYIADVMEPAVIVIDTLMLDTVAYIPMDGGIDGRGAWDLAITPRGDYVYVASPGGHLVAIIDTATWQIVKEIPTPRRWVGNPDAIDGPRGLIIAPDDHPCSETPVLVKTAVTSSVVFPAPFTFEIAYSYEGEAPIADAAIVDYLPDGTSYVSSAGGEDSYLAYEAAVVWKLGDLVKGSTGVVSVTLSLDRPTSFVTVI